MGSASFAATMTKLPTTGKSNSGDCTTSKVMPASIAGRAIVTGQATIHGLQSTFRTLPL